MPAPAFVVPADVQTPMSNAEWASWLGLPYADLADYSGQFRAEQFDTYWTRRYFQRALLRIKSLLTAVQYPIYNISGSSLAAGPVRVVGWFSGRGYLLNGAASAGAMSMAIDTGSNAIANGSIFTIDGVAQVFTSTGFSGGTLSFTPALPSAVADDTALTINAGLSVALALPAANQADLILTSAIANDAPGVAVLQGDFVSTLNTTGGTIGNPVYLSSTGAMSMTDPGNGYILQVVGYIETIGANATIKGYIQQPERVPGALIVPTFAAAMNTPTSTPASSSAAGVAGTWAWDASYIYICTATNTWKRVAISTW